MINLTWDEIKNMKADDVTCYVMKNDQHYFSKEHGILPLMRWLDQDPRFFVNATVIDKVIGKAAAMLLIYGGVSKIYAYLISEPALEVLTKHQVAVEYLKLVPMIINKTNTGGCPMEQRTLPIRDIEEAYLSLKQIVKV